MSARRVVLAKVGLDGHDVGVNLVAKQLMSAGFEVIYLGKRKQPEEIVAAVLQEDAAAVGVSSLSGGLAVFTIETLELLRETGLDEVRVIAGGVEEPGEIKRMVDNGISAYFGPNSPLEDVVGAFRDAVAQRG